MVRSYQNHPSLAEKNSLTPEEIKQIAISVLERLAELQNSTPPVIHRNIKPETILVDEQLNTYLSDFGAAEIKNGKNGKIIANNRIAGNPGFIPPENFYNRPLTEASDLYSLGATLICLLTGTRSEEIDRLIDDNYQFNFRAIASLAETRSNASLQDFLSWLEKMVAPNLQQRFDKAATALKALKSLQVPDSNTHKKNPRVSLNRSLLYKIFGLATVSIFIGLGITGIIYWLNNPARQLLSDRDCQGCNLQNANLEGAKLEGANLRGANLEGANLRGASLQSASLQGANLEKATLENASMQNASLEGANLKNANLQGSNLEGAFLKGANLQNANLYKTNLHFTRLDGVNLVGAEKLKDALLAGAYLKGANLEEVDLEGANLEGADLREANLKGANLKRTNLMVANLWGAKLEKVNLEDAISMRASLEFANLQGANLRGANLQCTYLSGANFKNTTMPDGSKRRK